MIMDYHSRKLRFWAAVGAVVCIFQYSALAEGYYSFGRSVNKSFGEDYEKTVLTENIFVPITGKVLDIDLALNIKHTSICDLQIYLKSPTDTEARCINSYDYDIHGVRMFEPNRANFYWTIFDAESPFSINSGKPPYTGLYHPNGPDSLTVFYGQQSYGTWEVSVYDWIYANTGTFKGVRLDFHVNPEPSSMLLFLFSAAIGIFSNKSKPL